MLWVCLCMKIIINGERKLFVWILFNFYNVGVIRNLLTHRALTFFPNHFIVMFFLSYSSYILSILFPFQYSLIHFQTTFHPSIPPNHGCFRFPPRIPFWDDSPISFRLSIGLYLITNLTFLYHFRQHQQTISSLFEIHK